MEQNKANTPKPREDIFDRMMHLPILRIFEPFYRAHKSVLLYLFFGFLTFLISIGSYALFSNTLRMNVLIANVFSWIAAVSFAYVTNRIWVFENTAHGFGGIFSEMVKFLCGRLGTLAVEELILWVFIEQLHFSSLGMKVVAQVVVIVLNYVVSKLFVFTKKQ